MNLKHKLTSVFLAMLMLLYALPLTSLASDEPVVEPDQELSDIVLGSDNEIAEAVVVGEVISERTERTKTFRLSDGSYVAADYGRPVHFLEDDVWVDFDNTLVDSPVVLSDSDDFAGYITSAGDVRIKLANNSNSSNLVKIQGDEYKVSMHLVGADKSKAIELYAPLPENEAPLMELTKFSSGAIYKDILPSVDLEYIISGNSVKENIIVKEKRDNYTFTFELKINGLTPTLLENGDIALNDSTGETKMLIPAAYMFDANGVFSDEVEYSLEHQNGQKYLLTVTADASWINTEDRAFPVTIDPPLYAGSYLTSEVDDGYVYEGSPTEVTGAYEFMIAGYDVHSTSLRTRSYVKLNTLPTLPQSSVIVEATLNLRQVASGNGWKSYTGSASSITFGARKITSSWSESTLNWNTKPSTSSIVLDYQTVTASTANTNISWDITSAVQDWYNGSTNYGIAIYPVTEYSGSGAYAYTGFYSSENPNVYNTTQPMFTIVYRDNKGLEDIWTYNTQSLGNATSYVNDYSGNLVVTQELNLDTGDFPYPVTYVYNGYLAGKDFSNYHRIGTSGAYTSNIGYGWQINFLQTFWNKGTTSAPNYCYTDIDGTDHYFVYDDAQAQYVDEDGYGYTLEISGTTYKVTTPEEITLTFSYGMLTNVSYEADDVVRSFTLSYTTSSLGGQLQNIKDSSGNIILSFGYNGYQINSITDSKGKTAYITQTSGNITSFVTADGETYNYTYSSNRLSSMQHSKSAYKLSYSYITSNGISRVSSISEHKGTANGQTVKIKYSDKKTVYETSGIDDNISTTSDNINTVYLFDNYGRTINIYTESYSGTSAYNAMGVKYGNINTFELGENNIQKISASNTGIVNLLNDQSAENSTSGWTAVSSSYSAVDSSNAYIGSKSLRTSLSTSSSTYYGHKQTLTLPAGTYTLSAYVKTSSVTGNGGALIAVMNSSGSVLSKSEYVFGTTNTSIQKGWRRISATVTLTASTTVQIYCGIYSATGTAYFDCLQLEIGSTYSEYNLLQNAGFETTGSWTSSVAPLNRTSTRKFGSYSHAVTGDPSTSKQLYQTINSNFEAGTQFVISGWAKANSVDTSASGRAFGINVLVHYQGSLHETFHYEFNPNNPNWQFMSEIVTPTANYNFDSIIVYLCYDKNANTAYFDNISVTIGGVYEVMSEHVEHETCDCGETLCTQNCSCGGNCADNGCDCPCNGGLVKVTDTHDYQVIDGVKYDYYYDANGNIISTTTENVSGTGSTDKFYTSSTYDNNNNLLTSTDERGKTTRYTYLNDMVSSVTDPLGRITNYTYTDDILTKLSQVINNVEVSNNYTYNSDGSLSSINHKEGTTTTQSYSFTYDSYGNLTSIKQGTTALVTYAYNAYNGKLASATYANGFIESYVYDALDNLSQLLYNNIVKYSYYYDNCGNLQYVVDAVNGTTERYEYDFEGNCVRTVEYNTSSKAIVLISENVYNADGELTSYSFIFPDKTVKTFGYTYDDEGKVTSLSLPNGYYKQYGYDIYGRMTSEGVFDSVDLSIVSASYSYLTGSGGSNASTSLVGSVLYGDNNTFAYSYDDVGNITGITKNGSAWRSYTYDALNQLTRENNADIGKTYVYTYDKSGNIQTKKVYAYTTGTLGTLQDTITYTYGNTAWKDQLTNYDGTAISYDGSGNPTNWIGNLNTLTWTGRQLSSIAMPNNQNINFKYNSDGIRTYKYFIDNDEMYLYQHDYMLDGSTIVGEKVNYFSYYNGSWTKYKYYYYDENGSPIGMGYEGKDYYFQKNILGDIEAIYQGSTKVVQYTYDAWGNVLSVTGSLASTIGQENPFRYRGYYYDTETGLYYLQSRYYDPQVGRFLNADDSSYIGASGSVLSFNLYAYCENNVIMYNDYTGSILGPITATFFGKIIVTSIVALLGITLVVNSASNNRSSILDRHVRTPSFDDWLSEFSGFFQGYAPKTSVQANSIKNSMLNVIANIKNPPSYKSPRELHHIVAKKSPHAEPARKILLNDDVDIKINSVANTVWLKTVMHRRLHTYQYYGWVNSVVIRAYNLANNIKYLKYSYVSNALSNIKTVLMGIEISC